MIARALPVLAAVLVLTGCGGGGDKDDVPTTLPITPGIYGGSHADGDGWRVDLPQGNRTVTARIARCNPQCGEARTVTLRAGMGGHMVDWPSGAGVVTMVLRADGAGVELGGDFGAGYQSWHLRRTAG